ncbi:MAG: crotonase/enoyl-CoA hydratase family protein [Betaproteobacteria bacterium]|nr:crotonase/enoyl-CoA hydratase family protein [Betaproteobacteria bacterium]
MAERILMSVDDAGVAEVRLNRPEKRNALDAAMIDGLVAAGERLCGMSNVRAVVLSGAGEAFCAGLDLSLFSAMADGRGAGVGQDGARLATRTHGVANAPQRAVLVWRDVPVPVIAAIHGAALGGGLQVALGADVRYVSPDARLAVMEIKWGLVPDMAGTVLMRELARADVARELAFSGRVFSGEEAVGFGLATHVCATPLDAARRCASEIAALSPDAVRAAKRLLNQATQATLREQLLAESVEQDRLVGSPNQTEAVAANLARRPPRFTDPA